jgi:hypothetical protein
VIVKWSRSLRVAYQLGPPHQTSPNVALLTQLITRPLKEHRTGANLRCRRQVEPWPRSTVSAPRIARRVAVAHRSNPSGWVQRRLANNVDLAAGAKRKRKQHHWFALNHVRPSFNLMTTSSNSAQQRNQLTIRIRDEEAEQTRSLSGSAWPCGPLI